MTQTDVAEQYHQQDPLINERQAAMVLGVEPGTLAVWRCTKRYPALRFVKIGHAVRYRLSDIERFIEARTMGIPVDLSRDSTRSPARQGGGQ